MFVTSVRHPGFAARWRRPARQAQANLSLSGQATWARRGRTLPRAASADGQRDIAVPIGHPEQVAARVQDPPFRQRMEVALRTRFPDRHQQQALRTVGRSVRRRRRRRSHDRPPRPPRRGHLPQGRQLPTQRPRPRPRPRGHQDQRLEIKHQRWSKFSRNTMVRIQAALTPCAPMLSSCSPSSPRQEATAGPRMTIAARLALSTRKQTFTSTFVTAQLSRTPSAADGWRASRW